MYENFASVHKGQCEPSYLFIAFSSYTVCHSIRIFLLVYINNKVYIDTGSKDGLSRKKYLTA